MEDMQTSSLLRNPELEQGLMTDWQHVQDGNSSNSNCNIPNPVTTTPNAPLSTVLPHREWQDLADLYPPAIMAILSDLTGRCATNRDLLHHALTDLETITQIFTAKHSPMSTTEHADYIGAFNTAVMAGRAIFPPQEAYRSAITTLGMLVTDLIDVLPMSAQMRKEFDEGMARVNRDEEAVRKTMREIAEVTPKSHETYSLAVYMNNSRQRLQNWSAEEERLKVWASECMLALV